MGSAYSIGAKINEDGDFATFSGINPGLTEAVSFVYKNEAGTWAQFGSTGRVKEQTASVTGYTGSIALGINDCAISENAHFLATGLMTTGADYGPIGFTGSVFIFEFDTGTTGYGTPTQRLIKESSSSPKEDYPYYGANMTFGPAINTGTTDSLMVQNSLIVPGTGGSNTYVYDIWEYNGSYWEANSAFRYTLKSNNIVSCYNGPNRTVYSANITTGTIFSRTFSDGNIVTSSTIDTGLTDNVRNIRCSSDGLVLYVMMQPTLVIRIYARNSLAESFTYQESVPYDSIFSGQSMATNGTGDKLIISNGNVTPNSDDLRYYIPPELGAGGPSQHTYISNGSDGTLTEGGVGMYNPNAKSNVLFASGGGYGGSASTNSGTINTGGGGAGRVNASGTAGGSGYIIVRRWNSGVN